MVKTISIVAIVVLATLGLGYVLLNAIVEQIARGMCRETIWQSELSPDGKTHALVFEINCGATTGFATQLGIAPSDRTISLRESTQVLIIGGQHPDLDVVWLSASSLSVTLPLGAEIKKKNDEGDGVTVLYR